MGYLPKKGRKGDRRGNLFTDFAYENLSEKGSIETDTKCGKGELENKFDDLNNLPISMNGGVASTIPALFCLRVKINVNRVCITFSRKQGNEQGKDLYAEYAEINS